MTTITNTHTIWVCTDCNQHAANGECGSCPEHNGDLSPHDREPLGLLKDQEASLGLTREEHTCGKENDPDDEAECECEQQTFSWSACEGCGSTLGGSRDAMTVWRESAPTT